MVLFQTILQASTVLRCSLEGSLHVGDQRLHTHLDLFASPPASLALSSTR